MSLGVLASGLGARVAGLGTLTAGAGVVWPGFQGGSSGPVIPAATQWRSFGGPMYMSNGSNATDYSYQNRVTNRDSEAVSHVCFEFATINVVGTIKGMAISIGGSTSDNPTGAWIPVTFSGSRSGVIPSGGALLAPKFLRTDEIAIPGNWAPSASMLVRITWAAGSFTVPTKGILTELSWPTNNKRSSGDYSSTDELLAINPAWSGTTYAPSWHKMRYRRVTARPAIMVHGDSVASMVRPNGSTNDSSGYGWCNRLNEATEFWHIASYGQGATTMADSEARNPVLLTKFGDDYQYLMVQGWSGNSPPLNIADTARIKANVTAMEDDAIAAGKGFLVAFLKPSGADGTDANKLAAFNEMRSWAATRYGIRCIDVSTDSTLVGGDGYTMLNSEDQAHFNGEGQRLQAIALQPKIEAVLVADGYAVA